MIYDFILLPVPQYFQSDHIPSPEHGLLASDLRGFHIAEGFACQYLSLPFLQSCRRERDGKSIVRLYAGRSHRVG